jgi:hypothetical protein
MIWGLLFKGLDKLWGLLTSQVPFFLVPLAAVGGWYYCYRGGEELPPAPEPKIIEAPVSGHAYVETLPPVIIDKSKIYYDTTWDTSWVPILTGLHSLKSTRRGQEQLVVEAETTMTVPYPTREFWVKTKTWFPSGRLKHWFEFQPYQMPKAKLKTFRFALGAGLDFYEDRREAFVLGDLTHQPWGVAIGVTGREEAIGIYLRKSF